MKMSQHWERGRSIIKHFALPAVHWPGRLLGVGPSLRGALLQAAGHREGGAVPLHAHSMDEEA